MLRVYVIGAILLAALAGCGGTEKGDAVRARWTLTGGEVTCPDAEVVERISPNGEPLAVRCIWRGCVWTDGAMHSEVGITVVYGGGARWLTCPNEITKLPAGDGCDVTEPPAPLPEEHVPTCN